MIVILLLFLVIVPSRGDAYIDPGVGSYFFQVLIASVFGVLFTIRSWLRRKKIAKNARDTKEAELEHPRDNE